MTTASKLEPADKYTSGDLGEKYDYWEEHPMFPAADWRYEVANYNTRQGYWEYVESEVIRQREEVDYLPLKDLPLKVNEDNWCEEAKERINERIMKGI